MKTTFLTRYASVAALTVTLFVGTSLAGISKQVPDPISPGKHAPNFQAKTTTGQKVSLKSLRGKVVVLDFWATWCGPCMAVTPVMVGLHKQFSPQGLRIIGMSLDESDSIDSVKPFIKRFHINYPVVTGPNGNRVLAKHYQVGVPPVIYVIDKKGRIRFSQIGVQIDEGADKRDLTVLIKKLLAEPA